jgi:UDP-glucose 4-epimerase
MKNKKILITGGAGFIGSHLATKFVQDGNQVTVIDNLSTGSRENLKSIWNKIDFIKIDINKFLKKNIEIKKYNYIFHLAGNPYIPPSVDNPPYDFRENLENTLLFLEVMRKSKFTGHFFYASSAAVYGNPEKLPIVETSYLNPVSPYGVSKLASERYVSVYSQMYKLKTTNLRFFSVYGPFQKKQVIFDLILKITKNPQKIDVYGDGEQIRDFIFVDDLVRGVILIAQKTRGLGETYNLASGKHYSIKEIIKIISRLLNAKPKIHFTMKQRLGDADKWIVNIQKIKRLGFKPQINIEEGILLTKNWADEQKPKNIYEK